MKRQRRAVWAQTAVVAAVLGMGTCFGQGDVETNRPAVTDEQVGEMLQRAVVLIGFGLDREAEPILRQILAARPDQPRVQQLLEQLEQKRLANDPGRSLREQVSSLIVPELKVREADVRDVFNRLRDESGKLAADHVPVNIVLLVPEGKPLPKVTLQLRKVPLLEALKYTAQAAGLQVRVDQYAVVIEPKPPKTEAAAPAAAGGARSAPEPAAP